MSDVIYLCVQKKNLNWPVNIFVALMNFIKDT